MTMTAPVRGRRRRWVTRDWTTRALRTLRNRPLMRKKHTPLSDRHATGTTCTLTASAASWLGRSSGRSGHPWTVRQPSGLTKGRPCGPVSNGTAQPTTAPDGSRPLTGQYGSTVATPTRRARTTRAKPRGRATSRTVNTTTIGPGNRPLRGAVQYFCRASPSLMLMLLEGLSHLGRVKANQHTFRTRGQPRQTSYDECSIR